MEGFLRHRVGGARRGLGVSVLALLLLALSVTVAEAQGPTVDCKPLEEQCWQECDRIAQDAAERMCYPQGREAGSSYSGCALDVVGCAGGTCIRSYNEYWCAMPGYLGRVQGPTDQYLGCIDGCNAKARSAATWGEKLGILGECGKECYEPYDAAMLECRNRACAADCTARGYSGGEWANYYAPAGGWDRCACLGDPPTPTPTATLPPLTLELRCLPFANELNERYLDPGGYAACEAEFPNPGADEVRVWWSADGGALTTYVTNVSVVTHDFAPPAPGRYWLQVEVGFADGRSGQAGTWIVVSDPGASPEPDEPTVTPTYTHTPTPTPTPTATPRPIAPPAMEPPVLPDSNRVEHHTAEYVGGLLVYRRAQAFAVTSQVTDFDDRLHRIRLTVLEVRGQHADGSLQTGAEVPLDPPLAPGDSWSGSAWQARDHPLSGTTKRFEVFIPPLAALGQYAVRAELLIRDTGEVVTVAETTPFWVVLNPWSDAAPAHDGYVDAQVHTASLSDAQLSHYVWGYAPGAAGPGRGINYYPSGHGAPAQWAVQSFDPALFQWAMQQARSQTSARQVAERLTYLTYNTLAGAWRGNQYARLFGEDVLGPDLSAHYVPYPVPPGGYGPMLYCPAQDAAGNYCRFDTRNIAAAACTAPGCPAGHTLPLRPTWWAAPGWMDVGRMVWPHLSAPARRPYGQCLDYSALLNALMRAVGVPSRMAACWGCSNWNYHAWVEVWLNEADPSQWSMADATPGELIRTSGDRGTATRRTAFGVEGCNSASAIYVYAYNGTSGTREDVLAAYRAAAAHLPEQPSVVVAGFLGTLGAAMADRSFQEGSSGDGDLRLTVETDRDEYRMGDSIDATVTVENRGTGPVEGELLLEVNAAPGYSSAWMNVSSLWPEPLTVPKGATASRSYTLTAVDYQTNGPVQLVASFAGVEASHVVDIASGYEIRLEGPPRAATGEEYEMVVVVTNVLDVPMEDIDVTLLVPPGRAGEAEEVLQRTIRALGPGETHRESFRLLAGEEGLSSVHVSIDSSAGGSERAHALVAVGGEARLEVALTPSGRYEPGMPLVVEISLHNTGARAAREVAVELLLPQGWSCAEGPTFTIDAIGAGESTAVRRTVVPGAAGGDALEARVRDAEGHSFTAVAFVGVAGAQGTSEPPGSGVPSEPSVPDDAPSDRRGPSPLWVGVLVLAGALLGVVSALVIWIALRGRSRRNGRR